MSTRRVAMTMPNAWIYSTTVVNHAGQTPTQDYLKLACPNVVVVLTPQPTNTNHLPVASRQDFQNCSVSRR